MQPPLPLQTPSYRLRRPKLPETKLLLTRLTPGRRSRKLRQERKKLLLKEMML